MRSQVNIHFAKTNLSKLIERAQKGEEIIVARSGTPVAMIVPWTQSKNFDWLGADAGKVWVADDFDAPLPDEIIDEFYK